MIPCLVNTHHHMYQTLNRAIPAVQDAELFTWLKGLYPFWAHYTGHDLNLRAHCNGLAAAVRLHGLKRPSLSVSQRRNARRHDQRGTTHRHARQHECGRIGTRIATGFGR